MKPIISGLCGAICLAGLLTGVSLAQLTPGGDAYVNTALPTNNYGSATTLGVSGTTQTAYITFDLSSLPAGYTGSNIAKASLKLYVNTVATAGSFNVDYVNSPWAEKTINATNAPPPGATIAASVPLAKAQALDYVIIDVTSAVQAWLNATEPNNGIALVANGTLAATFDSKESKTQSHPPELDIVFAGSGGGITGVLTGAGSGLQGGGTSGTLNLSLLTSCASKQLLQWNGSSWACSNAGTGTITGVTAGTDLTGGGNSGNVTLNLDTTRVPQLAAANTFSNTNLISASNANPALTVSNGGSGDGAKFYGGYDAAEFFGGVGGGIYADTHQDADFTAAIYANEWGSTKKTYGVWGYSASPSGAGVLGRGGSASIYNILGAGVWGDSSATAGVAGTSDTAVGVYGKSTGTNAIKGVNYASDPPTDANATMVLQNETAVSEFVLYAENYNGSAYVRTDNNGNLAATGALYAAAKPFKIDHPLDPANKYLLHTAIESPDMKDIYDGVIGLDVNGEATVELPSYFEALNQDFRYQLTCIGGYAPVYIAEEISNNRFRIAGGKPGLKVSWQVTGIRHDKWAEAHRTPVEVEKTGSERGRYLHPDAFGLGPEQSITYHEPTRLPKLPEVGKKPSHEMVPVTRLGKPEIK